ncbi:MAG TPA: retropepsin-like aspartic protease [Bryobacteraceae bacterium]|nr:retropepsin-like aspartic protease [Bryobacteraceae bacterium]
MKLTMLLLLASPFAKGADLANATARPILEAHRWFDLRDAVSTGKSPALYRGLVAAAFNDIARAEREFRVAIRSGASGDQQYAAHEALFNASFRNGLYRRAAMEVKRKWALKPEKTPPDGERALVRLFEQLPDLAIVSRKPATVAYTTWPGGQVVTPLIINGHAARFALDTDMNMSVISEAEAKGLGMRVSEYEVAFIGVTGSSAPGGHTAIADHLKVGGTEFRNVPFLVVPDSTGKLLEYPVEQRGILGLPVILAIQTFRWNREHRQSCCQSLLPRHGPAGGGNGGKPQAYVRPGHRVLVQREMESWRAPLGSITPYSVSFAMPNAVAARRRDSGRKPTTGFKKEIVLDRPHSPEVRSVLA